jgi:hypothetical protein
MSNQKNPDEIRRQRLDEVMSAFLVAVDVAENPSPQEWLDRHPDLWPDLANFFADRARLNDLIEPFQIVADDPNAPVARSSSTEIRSPAPPATDTQIEAIAHILAMGKAITCGTDEDETRGIEFPTSPDAKATFGGPPAPNDDDNPDVLPGGTQIRYLGDYELERVLGEGGMGIVHKARQLSLNRPVALKMIRAAKFLPKDAPEREIRLLEVNDLLAEMKDESLEPLDFGVDTGSESEHKLFVLDVTPSQWASIAQHRLSLPAGWSLDDAIRIGSNGG